MNRQEHLLSIVDPLLDWYQNNKRTLPWRENPTPYRVWISEIMLQQTRVEPVIPYYLRFLEQFPDVDALAAAPEDLLMKNWEGLGYYSRARNLQKAAKLICDNGAFPKTFDGWLKLPGIGEYTAGAICSIALSLPTPAVDGNVLRVLSRVLGSFEDIAAPATKKAFTEALKPIYPQGKTSEFTQGLMELGAIVCLPNGEPKCELCPLKELCVAQKQELIKELPVKTGKKDRKTEDKTVFILRVKDKVAVRQRPEKGLLANLWEFPNLPQKLTLKEAKECFGEFVVDVKALPESVHIFTHIEWHMLGYEVILTEEVPGYEWFSIREILSEKAIPTAFRCYINYLRKLEYEV